MSEFNLGDRNKADREAWDGTRNGAPDPDDRQIQDPQIQDRQLVFFLQQHCPPPPPSAPDLEARLLAQLDRLPQRQAKPWQTYGALLLGVGAAVSTALWLGARPFEPKFTETDVNYIEASLVRSWNLSLAYDADDVAIAYGNEELPTNQ